MSNLILQKEVRKYVKLWRLESQVGDLLKSMKEKLVARFATGAKVEDGTLSLRYSDVATSSVKYKEILAKITDACKVDPQTDAERVFAMRLAKKIDIWTADATTPSNRVTLAPIVGTMTTGADGHVLKHVTVKKDGTLVV